MKWKFEYLGESERLHYVCVITDDGTEQGVGISICYNYYAILPNQSCVKISYTQLPEFEHKPSKKEAIPIMNMFTRQFSGWIPYNMEIVNH